MLSNNWTSFQLFRGNGELDASGYLSLASCTALQSTSTVVACYDQGVVTAPIPVAVGWTSDHWEVVGEPTFPVAWLAIV
jgi:hypothetical protein